MVIYVCGLNDGFLVDEDVIVYFERYVCEGVFVYFVVGVDECFFCEEVVLIDGDGCGVGWSSIVVIWGGWGGCCLNEVVVDYGVGLNDCFVIEYDVLGVNEDCFLGNFVVRVL